MDPDAKPTSRKGNGGQAGRSRSLPPRRQFTVLVVDDETDIAEAARDVLEHMVPGLHVETADSCAKGLATLQRTPVDAVVVDYRMPGRSGLDFIRSARALEPHVPAILMTAYASIDLAVEAVNAVHVDGFLSKPVDAPTLVKAVEGALERSEAVALPAADGETLSW